MQNKKTLMIIGAGKTGEKIAREILTTLRHQYSIAGFVDDNLDKTGALLHGKKIFCKISELPNLKVKYDELLITAPSATGDQIRRIVEICKQTGKRYKTVPAMNEIIDGEISMAAVRDVSYSDLLGREEVKLDMNSIENTLKRNSKHEEIIENIDIGGPTMVRSAAKNYKDVVVISSSKQYEKFVNEIKKNSGSTTLDFSEITLSSF